VDEDATPKKVKRFVKKHSSVLVSISEQPVPIDPSKPSTHVRMSSVDKKKFFFNDKYQFAEDHLLDQV
jgi:hypothetical protein